ncbi:MAG TPA: TlpA disulfide reductase family protein [Polyangiales bacterium]|nr:TlpA disulfide reductase family protein [Polyangiales bacterium]
MRRLLLFVLLGCGDASPAPSRFEAVTAKEPPASAAELCDAVLKRDTAPPFVFPASLEGPTPSAKGPRWINVWATWCPPCVEELPILRKMEATLAKQASPVKLTLLSVDTTAEAVAGFASTHPEVKGSLRLTDDKQLEPWLLSIGLDRGATLPVHVFVHADGKIACVRTGAVKETDLAAIAALLSP